MNKGIIIAGIVVVLIAAYVIYMLWSMGVNYFGPWKKLAVDRLAKKDDPKLCQGQILFYGASNFTLWKTMEEDIPQYKIVNHGFGGSDDAALIKYANLLLYPFHPFIVVFQTGSNDYVNVSGSDQEKIDFCMKRKKEMFQMFHEKLPQAQFLVMAGLLLPGRKQYLDLTLEVNRQLKEMCQETPYMTYVDSQDMTYADGAFAQELFVKDQIHLNQMGQKRWANAYIIPALDQAVAEMGENAAVVRK